MMCKPASFVCVKGEPPKWSKYSDSHEIIRKEHGLPDNSDTRIVNVQVEITPPNGDMTKPVNEWEFRTDQDMLPPWWDFEQAEKKVRKELKEWIKQKVIMKDRAVLSDGEFYVYGGTIQSVYGGTIQYVDGGTIKSVEGGIIESVYGGTIQYVDGGTIIVYTAVDPACLKSSKAVMVDRSGDVVKCYVGKDG